MCEDSALQQAKNIDASFQNEKAKTRVHTETSSDSGTPPLSAALPQKIQNTTCLSSSLHLKWRSQILPSKKFQFFGRNTSNRFLSLLIFFLHRHNWISMAAHTSVSFSTCWLCEQNKEQRRKNGLMCF